MTKAAQLALGIVATSAVTAAMAAAPEHQYGPPPSWANYRALAEAELRERLVDPDSAKITWVGGFYKGFVKPFVSGRHDGYVACGRVNSRNRMGGYVGAQAFLVVIDYDRVLDLEIAHSATDQITGICVGAIHQGLFPPLTSDEDGTAPVSVTATSNSPASPPPDAVLKSAATGLTLRAMPEGAYVSGVEPGSAAAPAGLKPGMVIATVNGIALAGMGEAAPKVVDAAGAKASLALVGGTVVKLGAGR